MERSSIKITGKSTINGPFSIAMLNYQRVTTVGSRKIDSGGWHCWHEYANPININHTNWCQASSPHFSTFDVPTSTDWSSSWLQWSTFKYVQILAGRAWNKWSLLEHSYPPTCSGLRQAEFKHVQTVFCWSKTSPSETITFQRTKKQPKPKARSTCHILLRSNI